MKSSLLKTTLLLVCAALCTAEQTQPNSSSKIEIQRKAVSGQCIMGYLVLDGEVLCYSLELPWVGNINGLSTIPDGRYTGFVREDGSKGWRIELENVPNRTNIQIHIGNYTSETIGCTLVGMRADLDQCAVFESKKAMDAIKDKIGPLLNKNIEVAYSKI
ncbi:MAG: hypothetical protein KF734_12900 [Saprospiraceae bacterium]|nr:hypothetical protein [Saprospiraceae bacterium]